MFNTYFPKNLAVYEIMWKKYGTAGQDTNGDIMPSVKRALCLPE